MIFLRQSYNVKPPRWGSPADIEYAIKVNAEKVYDVDPDSIVLAMPLFWGLPCLDYSGKRNDGVNHGAYYKDGELEFVAADNDYIDCGHDASLQFGTGDFSVFARIKYTINDATFRGIIGRYILGEGWLFVIYNACLAFYDSPADHWHNLISDPLNDNSFHAVGFVKSGTSLKVYVDGLESNDLTVSSDFIESIIWIGSYTANKSFGGFIDKVGISNAALSANQIALFHALPYGLYQPVVRRFYSIPLLDSIIDPTITSITAIRTLVGVTQKRTFSSQTPVREVKSL